MRRISLLAVPLVLALSACASGTSTSAEPPAEKAIQVSNPEQVRRPIDRFYPSATEVLALTSAHQDEVNSCLRAAGLLDDFAYPPDNQILSFVKTIEYERVTNSSLWGFFDPENAERYGYQPAPGTVTSLSIPPRSDIAQANCPTASPSNPDPLTFVFDWALPSKGPKTPTSDSRVVSAIADWSACMKSRGYSYTSPLEPIGRYQRESDASRAQIRTARNDVACKMKTNMVGRTLAVQAAYDKLYIESHGRALRAFTASFSAQSSG